ncbi:MAG TPA: hypothetical protein VLM90_01220 [Candidatus Deferrimicrobium sp.]|nr:hypothetical protein [Candidatus Deferrimicrobium sp.]
MLKLAAMLLFLVMTGGCAENVDHDTALATKRAIEFAEATFVRGNLDQGYAMLADKARAYVPLNIFADKVKQMHPSGRPSKIASLTAAPIKGEKIVNVTLRGEGDGQFMYGIALIGTSAADYRVSTFSGGRSP